MNPAPSVENHAEASKAPRLKSLRQSRLQDPMLSAPGITPIRIYF